jgi:hypothetical protein
MQINILPHLGWKWIFHWTLNALIYNCSKIMIHSLLDHSCLGLCYSIFTDLIARLGFLVTHTPIGILLLTPLLAHSLSLYHLVADQLDSTELSSTSTVVVMSITTDICFIMMLSSIGCFWDSRFWGFWILTFLSQYYIVWWALYYLCRIWGSHSGGYEEYSLLGYNAV